MPSGRTLALAHSAWRKRSAEIIPFSMVMSVKDGDNSATGYLPIAPGSALAIQHAPTKKNHHWTHSIPHYVQTAELLMLAYTMVSTLGDAGSEWLHYDVARAYTARLRKIERLDALSDPNQWAAIAECEYSMRNDWHGRNLNDPSLSLTDLVSLSLENDKYPEASKFAPAKMPRWRPNKNESQSSQNTPRDSFPKYASNHQEPYNKRPRKDGCDHTTRGPKGNPYMERDFCRKNQRGACTHGLACKYAHDANELALVQACLDANLWVQAGDLRSGKAAKSLEDLKARRNP